MIKVIKDELHLTLDIEKLIKEIDTDGSGEIEFSEFKALLNQWYVNKFIWLYLKFIIYNYYSKTN